MTWDDPAQTHANLGWVWEGEGVETAPGSPTSCEIGKAKSLPLINTDNTDQESGRSSSPTPRAAAPHGHGVHLTNLRQSGMPWDEPGGGGVLPLDCTLFVRHG